MGDIAKLYICFTISPSYSFAQSKDPISNKDEYYMQVGLNSNIKEADVIEVGNSIKLILSQVFSE